MLEAENPIPLGVLVPSVNTVVEPDMYRVAPSAFSVHFSRLPVPSDEATVENLERLEDKLDESLRTLVQAGVKAVAFACTSGSFIKGPQWDSHLIERMETIISPATTTSEAVVSALKHLKVKTLSIVTPYPDPVNELLVAYLEARGFEPVNLESLHLPGSKEIRAVSPGAILDLARSANRAEAEGILIPCTDFRALQVIGVLEEEIRKPVVTSNQATFWKLMGLSGVRRPVDGFGVLLRKP